MGVYRAGEMRWRVVVFLRGKRRDWIVDGTKADAEAFEARMRVEWEQTETLDQRVVPTVSDFIVKHYAPHVALRLRKSTLRNRMYQLATIDEHLGSLRLSEVSRLNVDRFQDARLRAKIRPSTVNDDCKVLLAVLNYARDLSFPVPLKKIKPVKDRGPKRITAWTTPEVERLFSAAQKVSPEILPMLVLMANTGIRRGEAIALQWEHVAGGLLRVWPSDDWQPKDGEPREIPLNQEAKDWLPPKNGCRWVFPSSTGERFAFWPQRAFDRARQAAGLVGGPHRLRHTYATHFLQTVPDLFLLARVLGHSHHRVTELYSHLLPDHLARAAGAVHFAPRKEQQDSREGTALSEASPA